MNIDDYFTFLKFQSISADPNHQADVLACLEWLKDYLQKMGFEVEVWPTSTYPTLFASYCKIPSAKTLLIYNHYDVQPVDPLDEWNSPPFEPTLKGDTVFARGAQDNKGQCFYVLLALKTLLEKEGKLPVNVKLCIEGDEETGSVGLSEIAPFKTKELKADYLLIADLGIKSEKEPAITLGTRGIVTMEVKLTTATSDLHSGEHGGIALNPIQELAHLLSKLHDEETGRVMVPGFYDGVHELTEEERNALDFSFDAKAYERSFGALPIGGEKNYTPLESAWVRPTLEFNGIGGGYDGPGFKTVLPKCATAKISCRVVANQDPNKIAIQVVEFLEQLKPFGVKLHVEILHANGAISTSPASHIAKIAMKTYSEVFNIPCKCIMTGGSIGVVGPLAKASSAEVLFLGLGLPDDQIHAPNEHFNLSRIQKGMAIISNIILETGKAEAG